MTPFWFVEKHSPHAGLTLQVQARLHEEQTPFQKIEVVQTAGFGRMLLLDGAVMLTDRDEFVYHEMLVHPALFAHPKPEHVLIVGGGDGGSVREVVKHERVRGVTLVEIDGRVVDVCREYFPALTTGLSDPRVQVRVEDGFEFLDRHPASFDVILVDCTDPVPLTEESTTHIARNLFTPRFYAKLKRALRRGGLVAFQSENPFYSGPVISQMHRELSAEFKLRRLYLANIPTYPGGFWSFTAASDSNGLGTMHAEPPPAFLRDLRYFQPALFPGALVLPRYIERLIAV